LKCHIQVIKVNLVLVHYEKYTIKRVFYHFIGPRECGQAARPWLIHARGSAGVYIFAFLPGLVPSDQEKIMLSNRFWNVFLRISGEKRENYPES
jgi:hypothetical protein